MFKVPLNRPFPSYPVPPSVSKRVFVQDLSYENEFDLYENELVGGNKFSYEWFCTKTCFDPEVQGNSKIAYWMNVENVVE